ncbi:MAG: Holliday junction resolvase RuvX [Coriobacteriales bacterium]|nr:Holliday junction resolvase RuvX [Coriobacteriales bacterium]
MRVLALDIGDVRTGIAASDATGTVASPVRVLPTPEVVGNARTWRMLLEDYEPELLVCGLPMTMAGEVGPQAQHVKEIASKISLSCGIPLEFVDERLSSAEAKRILRRQGMNEKRMRGKVDMIAASLFLQTWLDANTN